MKESGSAVFIVRLFTKALKSQFFSKEKFFSCKIPACRQIRNGLESSFTFTCTSIWQNILINFLF